MKKKPSEVWESDETIQAFVKLMEEAGAEFVDVALLPEQES